ncbi:MAG TPA: glycosyltransferase family 2 protein [Oscillatoriaceae cyanobacterium]
MQRLLRNKSILDTVGVMRSRLLIARDRQAHPDIWSDPNPLVSVRICTYQRPNELVERAIASVLRQTYQNFEIVVVGDHAVPETAEALAQIDDPRIRYLNLPERPIYPRGMRHFWFVAGVAAALKALELVRGDWITHLDDDDEFPPDHIEVLLAEAREHKLEMVYGVSEYQLADDSWARVGEWPPRCGGICNGAVLYSRRASVVSYDPYCWIIDEPGDWNQWKRMHLAGVRMGFVNRIVFRHYKEFSMRSPEATREIHRPRFPQEILDDLAHVGAEHLLTMC